MPINFHDEHNRMTYAKRTVDESWLNLLRDHVDVTNKEVVDIGCGGGIYTKALVRLGAAFVTVINDKIKKNETPIIEKDSWTVWLATKNRGGVLSYRW